MLNARMGNETIELDLFILNELRKSTCLKMK